jgi:hypothetical protein
VAAGRSASQRQVPHLVGDQDAAVEVAEPGGGAHAIAVAQRPAVAAARFDHDELEAAADQIAGVEAARAQQLRARQLEVLVVMAVPDDAQRIDVVKGHLVLDGDLAEPHHRGRV